RDVPWPWTPPPCGATTSASSSAAWWTRSRTGCSCRGPARAGGATTPAPAAGTRRRPPPGAGAARPEARDDHASSLVLEAGAGTGKTTLLIDRIEALVRTGHARLAEIAVVTFRGDERG